MKTTQNSTIMKKVIVFIALFITASLAQAQNVQDIRWKSPSQVRAILGEPHSITSPVGTHATYVMWKYADFTVAFSNNKAFHLFRRDSLTQFQIQENRFLRMSL